MDTATMVLAGVGLTTVGILTFGGGRPAVTLTFTLGGLILLVAAAAQAIS